jgi:hypothetical protein
MAAGCDHTALVQAGSAVDAIFRFIASDKLKLADLFGAFLCSPSSQAAPLFHRAADTTAMRFSCPEEVCG